MKLTTSKHYTMYVVNNVNMRATIERSDCDLSMWNLTIDDLGIYIKLESKKEALQYIECLIDDGQIEYTGA